MNEQSNQEVSEIETQTKGYRKRSLWQWVLIYLVLGAVVYFALYLLFFSGGETGSSGGLY